VPKSDVAGEEASPTQPFPTLPKPLVPQRVTADDAWGITDADRKWCRERMASLRAEGVFTPPSVRGTLVVPGNIGGAHWGGVAIDPERGLIVVPTNRLPAVVRLIPRERYDAGERANKEGEIAPQSGTAYGMWRQFLLTPNKIPCTAPPWGTLTAIDAASGAVRWEVPLGTIPWLPKEAKLRGTGSFNLAGPIVTAGGLVFIGAAFDNHLRAFDVESGAELWAGELPVSSRATPMTYRAKNGKQYVVIAAGGQPRTGLPLGDYLVAFAVGK
jgi:quinoprotein glucose dehydrogenase